MEKKRCPWVPEGNKLYEKYHDTEWGVPVYRDRKIFEFLVLESAQAGLSWETILKKRSGYKKHFADFDYTKVAMFTKHDVKRMLDLKESEVIRNRAKIEAAIHNAQRFLEVQEEWGAFSTYMWSFVSGKPIIHRLKNMKEYPVTIPEAVSFAKDLKKRGFRFLGPTTIYAHMQAVGMVNDHTIDCFRYREIIM